MNRRNIKSLKVSEVGMGCMALSHGYGKAPEREYSLRAIREAYEHGCTFFDTAEVYGMEQFYAGHNEELVGEALKSCRSSVAIATKFRVYPEELDGSTLYDAVRKHLDKSLKNLSTDYADLYYLHRVSEEIPVEDIAEVMGRLIREGLIREWGLSAVSGELLERADRITPVAAVQNIYNLVERDSESEVFPYALGHDIAVVPFSPVASGLLSGRISPEANFEKYDDVRNLVVQLRKENLEGNQPIVDILRSFVKMKNATPAQISIAWMLHKYPNVIPIPGSKNIGRIIENLDSSKVSLTDKEFADLEEQLSGCRIYGHRGCVEIEPRGMRYGMPAKEEN